MITAEELLTKIDSKTELSDEELRDMVNEEYGEIVEEESSELDSRSKSCYVILNINDRYFSINFFERLGSENDYDQPVELLKKEYDKLIPEHYEHIVEYVEE